MAYMKKNAVLCVIFLVMFNVVSQAYNYISFWSECSSDSDCADSISKYCCDRRYPEDNVCRSECIGETCSVDSDCAPEEYCSSQSGDKCKKRAVEPISWTPIIIVFGTIFALLAALGLALFFYNCCFEAPSTSAPRNVVATRLARTRTTFRASQNQQQYQQPGCINRQPMTVYIRQNPQLSTNQPPPPSPNTPPPPYPNEPLPAYPRQPPPPYPV